MIILGTPMKNFFYTKTPTIADELKVIESQKNQILIYPLSPKEELQYKWNATVDRIYYSLRLYYELQSKDNIARLLSPEGLKDKTNVEKIIINYKKSLDYIFHNWLINKDLITIETINEVQKIIYDQTLKINPQALISSLQYIQVHTEHPIIQGALSYIIFYDLIRPLKLKFPLLPHLISELILYKNGYNFRSLIIPERIFFNDRSNYENILSLSISQQNLTTWLEYYVKTISTELKNNLTQIRDSENITPPVFFTLTDRQKSILSLLDNPSVTITNKKVQHLFKVSQITASRELAKLTSLGLLFAIGKGRSTYYTKV